MNLLGLVQRLHRETKRSGPGPTTLVGATKEVQRLADWINDAWLRLQMEPYNWRWMRASVDVPLPTAVTSVSAAMLGIVDFGAWRRPTRTYQPRALEVGAESNVWPLAWREHDWMLRNAIDVPQEPGHPQLWSIDNDDNLLLTPAGATDHRLRIDYTTAPTELLDDDDQPAMPAKHHMLLVWRALADAGKSAAAAEDVSRAADNATEMMSNLIADQAEEIAWAPPRL